MVSVGFGNRFGIKVEYEWRFDRGRGYQDRAERWSGREGGERRWMREAQA